MVCGRLAVYLCIHTYGNTSAPLALLMIAVMGLGMGLFHGLLAVVFNRFMGKQPLSFAALWVVQEWLKTWLLVSVAVCGYAYTEQPWLNSCAVFGITCAIVCFSVFVSAQCRGSIAQKLPFPDSVSRDAISQYKH